MCCHKYVVFLGENPQCIEEDVLGLGVEEQFWFLEQQQVRRWSRFYVWRRRFGYGCRLFS